MIPKFAQAHCFVIDIYMNQTSFLSLSHFRQCFSFMFRSRHSLALLITINLILPSCDDSKPPPTESMFDAELETELDADSELMPDAEPDMEPDAEPDMEHHTEPDMEHHAEPCGALPECPIGYECRCPSGPLDGQENDLREGCECISPMSRRGCDETLICRQGEECREIIDERTQRRVSMCWLDETTLTVQSGQSFDSAHVLLVGASSQEITPLGFETATPQGLDGVTMNFSPPIDIGDPKWNDCGYDGLCPDDPGYLGPDLGENDGILQGAFIAGFSHGRPAQYCPEELIGCDRVECCVSKLAHDELKAQSVVLRRGELTIAFVALDILGLFQSDIEHIRRELDFALSSEPELGVINHLIVGSSHSHEGPDPIGQYGPGTVAPLRSGRDPRWISRLRSQVVLGLMESLRTLRPARAEFAIIDEGIEGLGMGDSRPPYIFDDNIPVLKLSDAESGESISTLLSVANHAEFLWSENPYLSADYFNYTRRYIEEGLPAVIDENGTEIKPHLEGWGGVTVMFAGAVGGLMNPGSSTAINYAGEQFREKGFAMADAAGQQIAARLLENKRQGNFNEVSSEDRSDPNAATTAPLSYSTRRFLTTIENTNFLLAGFALRLFSRDIYNAEYQGGISFSPDLPKVMSEVSVVSLGEFTFFTAPGEVFPELLTGGYPDRGQAQTPVVGDLLAERTERRCDERGLPEGIEGSIGGESPCIVKANQENPPTWSDAPYGPYLYELVSPTPMFIGLGGDFLGYIIPSYDFEGGGAPGAHYEETNSASMELTHDWSDALKDCLEQHPRP